MKKRTIQETNFAVDGDSDNKFAANHIRMPTLRCLCGCEILVVPDLKAMKLAIKNHVAKHRKANYVSEGISLLDLLEESLAQQVLIEASKSKLDTA